MVHVQLMSGTSSPVEVLFASTISLNLDFILGMNGIRAFRGVTVNTPRDVRFGVESACSAIATAVPDWVINDEDFTITYNAAETQWTVLWKWSNSIQLRSTRFIQRFAKTLTVSHCSGLQVYGWSLLMRSAMEK